MTEEARTKISKARIERRNRDGYLNSPETRARMSAARKGKEPWNKGKIGAISPRRGVSLSLETGNKIRLTLLGRRLPDEQKRKISDALRGRPAHNKGVPHTEATKQKIGEAHRGAIFSPEQRRRISLAVRGKKNGHWISDRSKLADRHDRDLVQYAEWRAAVYKRDHYACRIENMFCSGRIEAHHILPWRDYVDLRFAVNNGITLCHFHHPLKRAEEERLSPYFQGLIADTL